GGGMVIDPRVTRIAMGRSAEGTLAGRSGDDPLAVLTRAERLVAEQVAEGRTNTEIAESLVLAEGTVKNHVSALLRQLGARGRTGPALALYQTLNGEGPGILRRSGAVHAARLCGPSRLPRPAVMRIDDLHLRGAGQGGQSPLCAPQRRCGMGEQALPQVHVRAAAACLERDRGVEGIARVQQPPVPAGYRDAGMPGGVPG